MNEKNYKMAEKFYKIAQSWDGRKEEVYNKLIMVLGKLGKPI